MITPIIDARIISFKKYQLIPKAAREGMSIINATINPFKSGSEKNLFEDLSSFNEFNCSYGNKNQRGARLQLIP